MRLTANLGNFKAPFGDFRSSLSFDWDFHYSLRTFHDSLELLELLLMAMAMTLISMWLIRWPSSVCRVWTSAAAWPPSSPPLTDRDAVNPSPSRAPSREPLDPVQVRLY